MKNILALAAFVLALALIAYLYQQLSATETALKLSEQRAADCQKVTFQLENKLAEQRREATSAPR